MLNELRKIPVFLIRDFQLLFSYKLAFSMSFLTIIFTLFHLVLFGSMFGSTNISALNNYGGNFIEYILIGSIGWGYLWSIMSATSSSLSTEMALGTLESILLTRTKPFTMMISYSIFGGFFGLITISILVIVGYFLFGITIFSSISIYTIIILFLSSVMMMGFGLIFGGLTIWLKNIGGTVSLLQNITMFFCGVYFPITVLPNSLEKVSNFIPFYYSIEGLRKSLIVTTPEAELKFYVFVVFVLSIVFLIIGLIVLRLGLRKAKKEGSLSFY